jgi:hypothetical protein
VKGTGKYVVIETPGLMALPAPVGAKVKDFAVAGSYHKDNFRCWTVLLFESARRAESFARNRKKTERVATLREAQSIINDSSTLAFVENVTGRGHRGAGEHPVGPVPSGSRD